MQIINVMDCSLDGCIAGSHLQSDAGRRALGFGSEADRRLVESELSSADAVITGANSVRAGQGVWDCPRQDGKFPTWFIFTNNGIEKSNPIWTQTHIPRVIVSELSQSLPQQPNLSLLDHGPQPLLARLMQALDKLEAKRVLLFGGGYINKIFYENDLVNELKITISPLIVARSDAPRFVQAGLPAPVRLSLLSSHSVDNHLFLHYRIH